MALNIFLLVAISIIHILASRLRFLHVFPRSIWLSVAGGASVAYVFLYLIPELIEAREIVTIMEHDLSVFFIALLGLCIVYGLEKVAKSKHEGNNSIIFLVHMTSYGLYNFIIGYLLMSRPDDSNMVLLLFFLAMSLHFIVNDYSLLEHYKKLYLRIGRWLLAFSVFAGGFVAMIFHLPEHVLYVGIAFISGGIIMNVLKEELPEERESKYWAFILGVAIYSTLLFFLTSTAK